MKQLIIILSIFFVASLSIQAQNRSRSKTSEKKEASKAKKTPARNVSTRAVKTTRSRGATSVQKAVQSERPVGRTTRPVRAKTVEQPKKGVIRKGRETPVGNQNGYRYEGKRTKAVNTHRPRIATNGKRVTANRKVTTNRNVAINSHQTVGPSARRNKIHRHGYRHKTHVHFGFHGHEVILFPRQIHNHYYYSHPVFLFASYNSSAEYPWAIYQLEGNANEVYIEGQVVDISYSRRTGRFVLHFGRTSPFQSATVVFSERLSRQFRCNKRMIRRLRGEYVSISGFFNDYGNVPTINVMDVDQIYVNEHPFADYIY